MKTNSAEFQDALLRAQIQHVLIDKVSALPAKKLKAVKLYVGMIRELNEGWIS